jgi:hypothetical protein
MRNNGWSGSGKEGRTVKVWMDFIGVPRAYFSHSEVVCIILRSNTKSLEGRCPNLTRTMFQKNKAERGDPDLTTSQETTYTFCMDQSLPLDPVRSNERFRRRPILPTGGHNFSRINTRSNVVGQKCSAMAQRESLIGSSSYSWQE